MHKLPPALVENAAQAIARSEGVGWDGLDRYFRKAYRECARAALGPCGVDVVLLLDAIVALSEGRRIPDPRLRNIVDRVREIDGVQTRFAAAMGAQ